MKEEVNRMCMILKRWFLLKKTKGADPLEGILEEDSMITRGDIHSITVLEGLLVGQDGEVEDSIDHPEPVSCVFTF